MRGQRQRVGADLVGHVTVRGDPVRADDHRVGEPLADQERRRAVAGQPVLDAELAELPAGQPRALEQRPGLVHDHMVERVLLVQRADHAERGAPAEAGERAGVAVGVHPEPAAGAFHEVGGAAAADVAADPLGVALDRERGLGHGRRVGQVDRGGQLGHLAGQVDRSGPGGRDPPELAAQVVVIPAFALPLAHRQRDAERAGHAEHRGAADGQGGDRPDQLIDGGKPEHANLVRQRGLVQRLDVPVPPGEHGRGVHTVEPMLLAEARDEVVRVCRELTAAGLMPGTSGNVSTREGDLIAVSPTGVDYASLTPDMVGVHRLDGTAVDAPLRPTSELPLHLAVYAAYRAAAIVHTHPVAATALSAVADELPAIHYQVAMFGGPLAVAPYATYGSDELAANVVAALRERTACLVANHGAVVVAPDLRAAGTGARYLEWLCEVYLRALSVPLAPRLLPADEIALVAGKLASYGQRPAT